ncbi:MAG: S8 family serine peptidase [Crocosphaera sp.]|nr:S8 family serine peptidase [Crocosphaera sp.]
MEKQMFYTVDGQKVPLKPLKTVGLVTPERNHNLNHVATRLASSSRLGMNTEVPANFVVLRGDSAKLEEVRHDEDVYSVRSAFLDPNGLEFILTDEVLVRFEGSVSRENRRQLCENYNTVILDDTSDIWRIRVLDRDGDAPLTIANDLAAEPGVEFAEPNALQNAVFMAVAAPTDQKFTDEWHLNNTGQGGGVVGADVKALNAWEVSKGAPDIRVVIHDSGVDINHPDLKANIGPGWDFDNNDDDASNPSGPHGTACAGIVAAAQNGQGVVGIAPNCKIIPLRAAGAHTWETWAQTFEWAAEHGDIISCSWSISPNNTLSAAIRKVISSGRNGKGIPVFCATGNDGVTPIYYPASMAETIAVGASTNQDRRAFYSSYGQGIDFVAPSGGGTRRIETTDIQGSNGYNKNAGALGDYCEAEDDSGFSGTSAATPLAAGVAALMLSVNPSLSAAEVRNILRETAIKIDPVNGQYNADGWSQQYGYGRIDAAQAVLAAQNLKGDIFKRASGPAKDIPDNSPVGIRDVIGFTESARISSIKVSVDITHTYRGDLRVTLLAPSGTAVVLHNRQGGRADDLKYTFDFTSTPELRNLMGQSLSGEWILQVQDLARIDYGRLNRWEIEVKGIAGEGDVILLEESPGVRIPDHNPTGIQRTLISHTSGQVQDIEVSVDLTHTYIGDLIVSLISPQNTKVDLHSRSGGSEDNLIKDYTLQTTPGLQQLIGESTQGNWKLMVADVAGLDLGKLNHWSLKIKRQI